MKAMANRRIQPSRCSKSAFLFHFRRRRVDRGAARRYGAPYEAKAIGKAMADEVAEKVKLNLDV